MAASETRTMNTALFDASSTHVLRDAPLGIESSFSELLALTEQIFQSPARIVVESDAELPAVRYVVVETTAGNDLKQVASRRGEWYRRVRTLLGGSARKVRLSIDLQP